MAAAINRTWTTIVTFAVGFLSGHFLGILVRAVLGF